MALLKGVKDRIDVKVTANVDGDMGRTIKVPFVITAKKPPQSERKQALKLMSGGDMDDEAIIREYLLGWHGLQGADGSDVPYSEESLQAIIEAPEYLRAVVQGILTAIAGKEALAKN